MDLNNQREMDQPEDDSSVQKDREKWNYVFLESLKTALFLPIVILLTEIFILKTWLDWHESTGELLYDYLFLFSMIFLIFVVFHLLRWKHLSK